MKKAFSVLTLLVLVLGLACPCAGAEARLPEFTAFGQLSGRTVSMLTGAPFEEMISSKVPDVGEFSYYNNMPDMILALKSGKTDAALINNAVGALAVARNSGLALFPQPLAESRFGIAFPKGSPELARWQGALDAIPEDVKRAAWEKWTGPDESAKVLPEQDWPGLGGTVRAAVVDTIEPLSYAGEGGELKGLDIEMILLMARNLDVHVEFAGMELAAILPAVQSGKADLGAGSIIVSDERKQAVDFVEYYPASFVLIVRTAQEAAAKGVLDPLDGKKIGILTGSIFAPFVTGRLPRAELVWYNSTADQIAALKAHKIDAFPIDETVLRLVMQEEDRLDYLNEYLDEVEVGMVFAKTEKGEKLCGEVSAWLRSLKESGKMERIRDAWLEGSGGEPAVSDPATLPAVKGRLVVATDGTFAPLSYISGGKLTGYEIDLVTRFCEENGYGLQFKVMNFDGILMAVQQGQVDFAAAGFAITDERKESVLFSEPDYHSGTVMAVLKESAPDRSFWATVGESFEKTFIRENRWQLFLQGIVTTLLITVLSVLFGTLLGFGVYMLCRKGNRVANALTRFVVWLVQGLPVVVLLMILYYIVFGKSSLPGTVVSVVGFTLVFGSAVYAMIREGVSTVDRGQAEAAYTLGYADRRAFFRVVLPQALPHILPSFRAQITSLIKATAVVGYIAVQDLTKMGDIIRSRTYDAFFPLIAVAVIYFILAALLTSLVRRIEVRIDPKQRPREEILKGVKTDD